MTSQVGHIWWQSFIRKVVEKEWGMVADSWGKNWENKLRRVGGGAREVEEKNEESYFFAGEYAAILNYYQYYVTKFKGIKRLY